MPRTTAGSACTGAGEPASRASFRAPRPASPCRTCGLYRSFPGVLTPRAAPYSLSSIVLGPPIPEAISPRDDRGPSPRLFRLELIAIRVPSQDQPRILRETKPGGVDPVGVWAAPANGGVQGPAGTLRARLLAQALGKETRGFKGECADFALDVHEGSVWRSH